MHVIIKQVKEKENIYLAISGPGSNGNSLGRTGRYGGGMCAGDVVGAYGMMGSVSLV